MAVRTSVDNFAVYRRFKEEAARLRQQAVNWETRWLANPYPAEKLRGGARNQVVRDIAGIDRLSGRGAALVTAAQEVEQDTGYDPTADVTALRAKLVEIRDEIDTFDTATYPDGTLIPAEDMATLRSLAADLQVLIEA